MHSGWRYWIGNKEVMLPVNGKCRVNTSEVLLQLALDGMGIVMFPAYIMGADSKSGRSRLGQVLMAPQTRHGA